MTSIRKNKWFIASLYILIFLLLAEWLSPVIALTETGHKNLFLIFIGLSLLMALLQVRWWISGTIKTFYVLWFAVYVYTDEVFFTGDAIRFLWTNFTNDFSAIVTQSWGDTSDIFRTVLFFALLWMAVYLIHYWVSYRLSIFLFYLLTVVFIAILDTFSPYTGNTAIIRIMVIGLLLAGLLHFARWLERHRIELTGDKIAAYMIPLALMVAAAAGAALYFPKSGPIWPDPVPYITSFSDQAGSGSGEKVGRIGYGVNDSQLGGSFIGDDTPVFNATVADGQYWKVESKDTYTTKGWELTENVGNSYVYGNGEYFLTDIQPGELAMEDDALVAMEQSFPFVLYPYGMKSVVMDRNVDYQYETADQRIETYSDGFEINPEVYEVAYSEPRYSLTALQATSEEDLAGLSGEFDRYKQLPAELPQRVRDLAVEITADAGSVYAKTRAIESYFSTAGFEYSQEDIPVPGVDQDYVDQFLFESKRGYCDNFSTSMVVMLRSLDIPARWVKGFNEGELIAQNGDEAVYQITNNNAHSWVEAYMPGVGWMLFEPTIGFTGAAAINFDVETETDESEESVTPERPNPLEEEEEEEAVVDAVDKGPSQWSKFEEYVQAHWKVIIWTLAGIVAATLLLFKLRKKWLPIVLIPFYRVRVVNAPAFEKAYVRLLKQLELYGIKRQDGQTLKSYAAYIDAFFGTHHMMKLTLAYEKSLYGGKEDAVQWHELKESWEYLIKQTSG